MNEVGIGCWQNKMLPPFFPSLPKYSLNRGRRIFAHKEITSLNIVFFHRRADVALPALVTLYNRHHYSAPAGGDPCLFVDWLGLNPELHQGADHRHPHRHSPEGAAHLVKLARSISEQCWFPEYSPALLPPAPLRSTRKL